MPINKKNQLISIILTILVCAISLASAYILYTHSYISEQLRSSSNMEMAVELLLLFFWIAGILILIKQDNIRYISLLFIAFIYLWMHRIMLPVIVSGLYVLVLTVLGELVLVPVRKSSSYRQSSEVLRIAYDFLIGSCCFILFICLLSLTHLATISNIRLLSVTLGIAIGLFYILLMYVGKLPTYIYETREAENEKNKKINSIIIAIIAVMVLMQAGRINIALDYDSLHYGLRSQSILINTGSVYDNLGFVNDVYVYPKGLEILAIPLNSNISYGYVLAFSLWMAVGVLFLVYDIVKDIRGKARGLTAALIISAVPAIMNMSISAKTDIITLFVQLVAVASFYYYTKEKERHYLYAFIGACLASFMYKPTSVIFTGGIILASIIYALVTKKNNSCKTNKNPSAAFSYIVIPFLSLIAVTARTFIITGLPITSAYTGYFTRLGFKLNYPFASGANIASAEYSKARYIERLAGLFVAPVGSDMSHVYIAWAGIIILIALIGIMLSNIIKIKRKKQCRHEELYLNLVFVIQLALCLFTLNMLNQVDGNYYILLYTMVIIVFCISIKGISYIYPAVLYGCIICTCTNWAGASGLTNIKLNHMGFYDHRSDVADNAKANGMAEIYGFLDMDKSIRVHAMAEQPSCFISNCVMQSYTDVEGSCGNVVLAKTLENFKDYLDYAKIDYILAEDSFLDGHTRAGDIVRYMLEDGSLTEVITDKSASLYSYKRMPTLP